MTTALGVDEYRDLLTAALPDATDADTVEPSLHTLFTPDSHRSALFVDNTVVRGGRGVGKTFWYRSLLDETLRDVAADEYGIERLRRLEVAAGHGAALEPDLYPGPGVVRALMEDGVAPYDLWNAVLMTALGQSEVIALPEWADRIAWVRAHPGDRDRTVARIDREAQQTQTTRLILFDALEHLHRDRAIADRLVGGLLELALAMRLGTRNIRCKIFIRPDMFDGARQHFPDASKLTSNASSLRWSRANLYGLLFHYLGNHDSEQAARFRELTGGWTERTRGRFELSATLKGDADIQADQFTVLAGPYMGANYRKGNTYTWLPNHLMDGVEEVSPRSFLAALSEAVEVTRGTYAGHEFPLHHEGIRRGVQQASTTRVGEVREDIPWVRWAIEPLGGTQVPMDEESLLAQWAEADLAGILRREAERAEKSGDERTVRTGPRNPDSPLLLIEELIALGVMRRRRDGRIDLPDVYRIAFSIGRKGGVPKVRATH
ncbi:hypothetical protein QC334_25075 [Streptomyces sp. DH18]|uniref:hypothetical protein n=1 Tax=Streptomyces sp. DH18 TaxID=3040126 RepID=UPI0024428382|nr:hypothetical protein [Streptomyces sp. DH18]MDG9685964.1 hypothetical protein [Streptomyces sp. DH18]